MDVPSRALWMGFDLMRVLPAKRGGDCTVVNTTTFSMNCSRGTVTWPS